MAVTRGWAARWGMMTVVVAAATAASADSRTPRVSDRENGAYYDAQWRAALEAGTDWVVVTSWTEWWENTHIEPSVRYGDFYVRRTSEWATRFRMLTMR